MLNKRCGITGCDKTYYAHGYCGMHYQRNRKNGSPDDGAMSHAPPEVRFMRRVEKSETGCWMWKGAGSRKTGYGLCQPGGKGTSGVLAHRFSYQMHKGPIPKGLHVRHSCNVRRCVNPDHLSVGTHQDNMDDMTTEQRVAAAPKGEAHHAAVLNEEAVRDIRSRSKMRGFIAGLSKQYGVTKSTIGAVRNGSAWKHVN